MGTFKKIHAFWFAPRPALRLELFQRVFSATFFLYVGYRFLHAYEWLTDAGFHLSPGAHPFFQPLPLPTMPVWAVPIFGFVFLSSILWLIFARFSRIALWIVLLGAIYIQLVDLVSAFTINKIYIVGFAVLAVSPKRYRDSEGTLVQSAWALRVLQFTILIQYFTAGTCKALYGDWLQNPDVLWTQVQGVYRTEIAAWLLLNLPKSGFSFMMYGSLFFELFGALFFVFKKLRPLAYLMGVGFHLGIAATMHSLIFFSLQMISFYVLFFGPKILKHFENFVDKKGEDLCFRWNKTS